MKFQTIKVVGGVEIANDIQKKIQTVGVRGLDLEKAKELGVFRRMGYLLCACHSSVLAAYRIYGGMDYLVDQLRARKNEIAREMNNFDKAFDHFVKFWTSYYADGMSCEEVVDATESLYHNIMTWMQIPEDWQLGDEQRTHDDVDMAIKFQTPDKCYTFNAVSVDKEIKEQTETWCVLKYNAKTNKQESVETDMDKASAMMSAKRLSANDKDNIYTAAIVRDIVEKRTDIIPFKIFKNNETIGKIINNVKKR